MSLLLVKKCSDCNQVLSISEFYPNRCQPSGYHAQCKACCKVRNKQRIIKIRESGIHWEDYLLEHKAEIEPRFWSKTETPIEGCWLWQGAIHSKGYGHFGIQGEARPAHRISYILTYGKIGNSKIFVCHKCDRPSCIRPDHLFLGTQADNMRDCAVKGRAGVPKDKAPRGERNFHSKLTDSDVAKIRQLYQQGMIQVEIAKLYNVNQVTISAIILRRTWKHIE